MVNQQPQAQQAQPPAQAGAMVDIEDQLEDMEVEETEDGGAIIRLENEQDLNRNLEHFANIVEDVDQDILGDAVDDLLEKISKDKDARKKRDELYEEGLRRTGLGDDAPGGAQFSGANKVVHPMLIEACIDFSARAMKEIFPPNGPVRSKIVGEMEKEKLEKAERKAEFMNWQTTEQMPEFKGELEQLSTQLPLGGAQYLKLMWSPQHKRPLSEFVPIDDVYLPFAATNFYSAERKTHVQYITAFEYQRRVRSGMYIDVDLPTPEEPEYSRAGIANDKIEGRTLSSYNEDGLRTIFEVYTHLDFGDGPEPYILSIDKSTDRALSLYRNWEPDDEAKQELDWIVEFPFIPWRGAYPIGLTHMIGGLSGAATGAMRALLDSAHIQNIPTLLKLKGGPNGQTLNVQPTEVVEIEGGINVDDVRKIAMPMPFNPPSPVLFQLLGFLVDAGKGVVQTSFEKLSDQNPNMPVGTTVALIEQGMVVFSSIHARLHSAMSRVLKILHRLNSAYLTDEIVQRCLGEEVDVRPDDFDGPLDVIPVSDPNVFSETQRFAQVQAVMQRAAMLPQLYDLRKVEELFLRQLKVNDDLLQPMPGKDDMDPASENVAASMGRPVYVLPKQDHLAHLKVHLAFLQSPLMGQNPVILRAYLPAILLHLRDHLLNYYMVEAHKSVAQATEAGQLAEDDGNAQADVIQQVQRLIEQQFQGLEGLMAQADQQAQEMAKPQFPPDNQMAVAQLNAQIQQQALQQRAQTDQAKLQLEQQKSQIQAQLEAQKLQASQADQQLKQQETMAKLQQGQQQLELMMQKLMAELQDKQRARQEQATVEMAKQQAEDRRHSADIQARMEMNASDNETAMKLAAAEIASGERVAVSTGTGINPNP
jgi:hypothetical protein